MSATMIEPEIQNELNKAMQKSLIRVKNVYFVSRDRDVMDSWILYGVS